jgi:hypothetical protein
MLSDSSLVNCSEWQFVLQKCSASLTRRSHRALSPVDSELPTVERFAHGLAAFSPARPPPAAVLPYPQQIHQPTRLHAERGPMSLAQDRPLSVGRGSCGTAPAAAAEDRPEDGCDGQVRLLLLLRLRERVALASTR